MSAKIKLYDTKIFSNDTCKEEKILLISQLEKLKVEDKLLGHTFIGGVIVEKSILELYNEVNNIFL